MVLNICRFGISFVIIALNWLFIIAIVLGNVCGTDYYEFKERHYNIFN